MKNIINIVKYAFKIAPIKFFIYFIISLPTIILPTVSLAIERKLIDNVSNSSYYIKDLLILIFLLVGSFLLTKITEVILNYYREFVYFQKINLSLQRKLSEKVNELSLEKFESASTFEFLNQAKNCSMFIVFTANMANMLIQFLLTLVFVGGYLTTLNPILLIFAFLIAFPVIIEKVLEGKKQLIFMKENINNNRYIDYYKNLIKEKNICKEVKLLGVGNFFENLYNEKFDLVLKEKNKLYSNIFKLSFSLNLLKGLCRGFAFIILVLLLINNKITVGEFTISLSSFVIITSNLTNILQFSANIMQTSMMSAPYFKLLNMEKIDLDAKNENIDKNIKLENVTYLYPNTEKNVLKNINFNIDKGQMVAIVGTNGAGKSTLLKLVSGMIVPNGNIFYGNKNRKEISGEDILKDMSAVCQNFGKYKMSLLDNVLISDSNNFNEKNISDSLKWANMDLPINTEIGKEFGGIDLSGGQWQRIALARCYYRDKSFVFMDEPTSAIDPIEEDSIYKKLLDLAKNKTVLLIKHRLGIVKNANKIIVLQNGELIEQGTFNELMDNKSLFYNMWNEQAKWYNRS